MNLLRTYLTLCTLALAIGTAHAVPLVSVDLDPGTPGVQSTASVINGGSFTVDIVIEGVEAAAPLNAFEFDLLFDNTLLAATSVAEGGFLLEPKIVLETLIDNTTGAVGLAAVTLLPAGAEGGGVLGSIVFDTLAAGTSVLDLDNVLLSAPFGIPIEFAGLQDGSIDITPSAAAPEPLVPVLLGGGLLALAVQGRFRRRQHRARG